jgi:hypothetical protein
MVDAQASDDLTGDHQKPRLPLVRAIFGRPVDALLFDAGHSVQNFLPWFHNLPPIFAGLLQGVFLLSDKLCR